MTADRPSTTVVNVRFPEDIVKRLDQAALQNALSRSDLIRLIVMHALGEQVPAPIIRPDPDKQP